MSTIELNDYSLRSIEQTKQQIQYTIALLDKSYSEVAKGAVVENFMSLIDALIETTEQLYFIEYIMAPKNPCYHNTHHSKAFEECISQLHNHHTHMEFISLHTFSLLIDNLTHFNMLLNSRLQFISLLDDD